MPPAAPLAAAYRSLLHRGRLLPDAGQTHLVDRLSLLQTELLQNEDNKPPRGVYIHGGVGTGKSRIADLFASTLPAEISRRRVHFHAFMLDMHARLHQARMDPANGMISGDALLVGIGAAVRRESRVLCFDEFQVTDIADAMILRRLFDSIWARGGVLVSTSNRVPERLYEHGLNRDRFVPFLQQLASRCEVWEMPGREDYRMKSTAVDDADGQTSSRRSTVFLDQREFDDDLMRQLDGRELQLTRLDVAGARELNVLAVIDQSTSQLSKDGPQLHTNRPVIRSTFEELCEAHRGAADYLALCQPGAAIYLSGLRRFRSDELDVVRRFITLVDLAYETRARLICLSRVPLIEVFAEIVAPSDLPVRKALQQAMSVRREGGSSSSMMTTFVGETEWSATGLADASLATGGAGEKDVGFAIGRAISRLFEMGSSKYGTDDGGDCS